MSNQETTLVPKEITLEYLRANHPDGDYPNTTKPANFFNYSYTLGFLGIKKVGAFECIELYVKQEEDNFLGKDLYRIRLQEDYITSGPVKDWHYDGVITISLDFYTKNNVVKIKCKPEEVTEVVCRILHAEMPGIITTYPNINILGLDKNYKT